MHFLAVFQQSPTLARRQVIPAIFEPFELLLLVRRERLPRRRTALHGFRLVARARLTFFSRLRATSHQAPQHEQYGATYLRPLSVVMDGMDFEWFHDF